MNIIFRNEILHKLKKIKFKDIFRRCNKLAQPRPCFARIRLFFFFFLNNFFSVLYIFKSPWPTRPHGVARIQQHERITKEHVRPKERKKDKRNIITTLYFFYYHVCYPKKRDSMQVPCKTIFRYFSLLGSPGCLADKAFFFFKNFFFNNFFYTFKFIFLKIRNMFKNA